MEGQRFQRIEETKEKTLEQLDNVHEAEISTCMEQWKHQWEKYTRFQGEYLKGNKLEQL